MLASSTQAASSPSRRVAQRRREQLLAFLRSIHQDAQFVREVALQYRAVAGSRIPMVPNSRCGDWYVPTKELGGAGVERAYFKSTDGHTGQVAFSFARLNLHVAMLAATRGAVFDTPRNFPNKDGDDVVAEAELGRAAKKRKNAASKSSRFRGVGWNKKNKNWQVRIRVEGKTKHLGSFVDEFAAARAYDASVVDNSLDRQRLNFPVAMEDDESSSSEDEKEESPVDGCAAISRGGRQQSRVNEERRARQVPRDVADPRWKKIRIRRASGRSKWVVIRGQRGQASSESASLVLSKDVDPVAVEWEERGSVIMHARSSTSAKTSGLTSNFRGVSWDTRGKKWKVQVRVDGKPKHIGYFVDEIGAARAYDAFVVAKKVNTPLNFPGAAAAKGHVVISTKSSRFRGVAWDKRKKKLVVKIRVNGKQKHIGYFVDEIEAAHAFDAYAIENGINVPRNFPDEDEDEVVAEAARVRAAPKKRKNAASKMSRFRGVRWNTQNMEWQIQKGGKKKFIGTFSKQVNAGRAYDKHFVENNLDDRPLRFPVAAEEDDDSSSEESSDESDDAEEDHEAAAAATAAAAAAVPAAKWRRMSSHSSRTVVQSDGDDMEQSSSYDSVLESDVEVQLLLNLTANAAWRRALPLYPCQPLRPSHL